MTTTNNNNNNTTSIDNTTTIIESHKHKYHRGTKLNWSLQQRTTHQQNFIFTLLLIKNDKKTIWRSLLLVIKMRIITNRDLTSRKLSMNPGMMCWLPTISSITKVATLISLLKIIMELRKMIIKKVNQCKVMINSPSPKLLSSCDYNSLLVNFFIFYFYFYFILFFILSNYFCESRS